MKLISSLVVFLMIFLVMGGLGMAEQHDRLMPLLLDLDGWNAQPGRGMSMVSAKMKVITANRVYSQADKTLNVSLVVNSGPVVDSDLQGFSFENESMRVRNRQIDEFWVKSTHNKRNDSGEVMVFLDYNQEANSVLVARYVKMNEDEVLPVIKGLDWVKLKKVVSPLL